MNLRAAERNTTFQHKPERLCFMVVMMCACLIHNILSCKSWSNCIESWVYLQVKLRMRKEITKNLEL